MKRKDDNAATLKSRWTRSTQTQPVIDYCNRGKVSVIHSQQTLERRGADGLRAQVGSCVGTELETRGLFARVRNLLICLYQSR